MKGERGVEGAIGRVGKGGMGAWTVRYQGAPANFVLAAGGLRRVDALGWVTVGEWSSDGVGSLV